MVAIARHEPDASALAVPRDAGEARDAHAAFVASRRIAAATDVAEVERLAVDAIVELCDADRVTCLFHDADTGQVWSERDPANTRHATAGLVGYAASTGLAVRVARGGDDPRHVPALDGDPASALLVQSVIGNDGQVHAVLVAARVRPFDDREANVLRRYAALIGPLLDQLSMHVEVQAVVNADDDRALFRREAIEAAEPAHWGNVIRRSPGWLAWGAWGLGVLFIAGIALLCFGTVSTYSTGPAVIRSLARTQITARTSGNVHSVAVLPGDRVEAGAVIARLDDVDQRAAVDRVGHELETQLRNHLLDPGDTAADAALRTLRLELERARAALAERTILAPASGTISDLRVRPGQRVEPGDIAASILDGDGSLEVVALLPGEDRPQLAPGMPLRLEVAGYRHVYETVTIEQISADVISPTEARRVLGIEVADGLSLGGPVMIVRARLSAGEFTVDNRALRYHDGMFGRAQVETRSERIVFALVPGLRSL
jgi:biotin carboxyl carrier protein